MVRLQDVRKHVSDQSERHDFSCYPMDCEEFIDLMTDHLFFVCKRDELEIDDIDEYFWRKCEDFVVEKYERQLRESQS